LVDRIVKLQELNGAVGLAMLGQRTGVDEIALTKAYTQLGEALGLDWAQNAANHFAAGDQWERLLTAGLARDFEELRLGFLDRRAGDDPRNVVDHWVREQAPRIDQFRRTVERARTAPSPPPRCWPRSPPRPGSCSRARRAAWFGSERPRRD
jgi:glutamate dehydrogenase